MLTAAFGDLPSVDASGQLDVRDGNVDDPSPAPRQAPHRHWLHGGRESFLTQSFHHELAYEGGVLDEEYSHRLRACRYRSVFLLHAFPPPWKH